MSSQDLNTIFDIKNLKAMSRNTDFVFKGVYELKVRKVKGDTTTFFVTLQFIPKKVQPYADFQAERMAHPKFSDLFPQGEDSSEIIGEYFSYLSKYFKSRDFISSFQTDMIKYVNKLFGQKGGFGIYPIQDYDIIDTEPFTVVELAFKGHFTKQNQKIGHTMSLRNKVIRLAHQKPELREHLLPLVTKTAARFYDGRHEEIYHLLNDRPTLYPPAGGEMDTGEYDRRSDTFRFTIYFAVESSSYYQKAKSEYYKDKRNRNYSSFANNFSNFATVKRGTAREIKQLLEKEYLDGYEVVKVSHLDVYDDQGYGDCVVYIN